MNLEIWYSSSGLGSHFQVPDVFEDMEAAAGKMQGWLSCPFSIRKFPCEYEDPSKTAQISSNHLLFTIHCVHFCKKLVQKKILG